MNSQKLNCESTRNIFLNEAVQLCANRTSHSFQRTIIVNLFYFIIIVRWNEWPVVFAHNYTALSSRISGILSPFSF